MLKKTRPDGSLIPDLPAFTTLLPYLMRNKIESTIYYDQQLDVTRTLAFIKETNRRILKERRLLTLFEVVLAATARTVTLRPRLNRFISGGRYWQRNRILFNFVAKKELSDDGTEVNVKIPFEPEDTLLDVADRVGSYVKAAISEAGLENEKVVETLVRLPRLLLKLLIRGMNWLDAHNMMLPSFLESDPMWCSVFLTNVGSFGLDAPFHHLFERGNCHIFMSVGKVRTERTVLEDGRISERKMLGIRYAHDDRIAEGVYMGRSLALVKEYIENPELLLEPATLTPEIIAEHRLAGA